MKENSRLQAVIEVLDAVETTGRPADRVLDRYLRERRYIGGGDRGAITERFWGVLRRRARIDWTLKAHGRRLGRGGRGRVLADLVLTDGAKLDRVARLFDGSRHGPGPLSRDEIDAIRRLEGRPLEDETMPAAVRLECPVAIWSMLESVLGEETEAGIAALREEAPFDLRINPLVAESRETVIAALAEQGIRVVPTPLSPIGLRFDRRRPVDPLELFKSGAIEVQDEGSQIAALLADARPGMTVVDYCAGAGGKSLVLAAGMANKGRLLMTDTSEGRLKRATVRLRRAGVQNAERRVLTEGDKTVKRLAGKAARVLVDAPCSGTGTWRRNPDARWRYGPDEIASVVEEQTRILEQASRLVAPDGRLVYVTCSILREENEAVVEAFLAAHPGFALKPVAEVWAETIGGDCPAEADTLRLFPHRHDTDGFFVAVLERAGERTEA